jgi:hypothetical protein
MVAQRACREPRDICFCTAPQLRCRLWVGLLKPNVAVNQHAGAVWLSGIVCRHIAEESG